MSVERHASTPPQRQIPLGDLEAIPRRQNSKCMATEDPGELELVAAAADDAFTRDPIHFSTSFEFGVVSDEEAVFHLIRGVMGSHDKLLLELREGERRENRGRM